MERNGLVLLVDDNVLVDKLFAHEKGLKHYAFSVFIFNDNRELLLQRRALGKYHSSGLWSNSCCSHPLDSDVDIVKEQATWRLAEEMGIASKLDFLFEFEYEVDCGNMIENEYDFIFGGISNETPAFDKNEVSEYKWVKLEELLISITDHPGIYTKWLAILITKYYNQFTNYLDGELNRNNRA